MFCTLYVVLSIYLYKNLFRSDLPFSNLPLKLYYLHFFQILKLHSYVHTYIPYSKYQHVLSSQMFSHSSSFSPVSTLSVSLFLSVSINVALYPPSKPTMSDK